MSRFNRNRNALAAMKYSQLMQQPQSKAGVFGDLVGAGSGSHGSYGGGHGGGPMGGCFSIDICPDLILAAIAAAAAAAAFLIYNAITAGRKKRSSETSWLSTITDIFNLGIYSLLFK